VYITPQICREICEISDSDSAECQDRGFMEMWRRIIWYKSANVSEEPTSSTFKVQGRSVEYYLFYVYIYIYIYIEQVIYIHVYTYAHL
jgi:hypothetical protein